ncbi:hypothetical protein [Granulicella sp. S190]|uniref:hypothetical protein n=1 Tax=Granulicella sp. S190 TaxID=1747226 RepID=UPI00131E97D1|nr:hypothetical protein [Granulicella sp. S190]
MKAKQMMTILTLLMAVCLIDHAIAQTTPTATQSLQLLAFTGGTATFTDLERGENLDVTAGVDVALLTYRFARPAFEIRGSYPAQEGTISSQKSFLLGPKIGYSLGRLRPYANFLIGRGAIDYLEGGYAFGDIRYITSNTLVLSPGVGLDYRLGRNLAVKVDFQHQHWDTPAVPSGSINPKSTTLGAVYTIDFNHRRWHDW